MFCYNTPPFHPRGRRHSRRGRPHPFGHPPFGPNGRFRGPGFGFFNVPGPFFDDEHLEVDLDDVGAEYCFNRAVPGISADGLHVDVQGPVLTVKTLTEVPGQRFKWQILVPDDVELDAISAQVDDGMLAVRLPKRSVRVIPVTSSSEARNQPQMPQNRTSNLWQLENWGSEYRLTHPAPGRHPNDIVVDVEEGFIFVKCQGSDGRFSGEFNLPPGVDVDSIMVDIIDGVLVVTMPKLERGPHRIQCRGTLDEAGPSAPPPVQNDDAISEDEDAALYDKARLI